MTTLIKTKFKKSDDQINIDKYRVAANITEYHIKAKILNHYSKIHKDKAVISFINVGKMSKINIFKKDVWTFWFQLSSS